MPSRCCEFVDSRLRRSPPDRASAVPMDKPGKTRCVSPTLPTGRRLLHKLHSTPQQHGMILISGNGEITSRLYAFSLFFPGSCPNNRDRRRGTSLPDRLSELAIITTAQFWRAQYEWYAHAPLAEKAGVPAAAVEAIRLGETPSFTQRDEALVYRVCTELFKTRRLSDGTFNDSVTTLGETGLTEVIAIIGYYTLIGNTLNAFQVAVPEGITPPFPE